MTRECSTMRRKHGLRIIQMQWIELRFSMELLTSTRSAVSEATYRHHRIIRCFEILRWIFEQMLLILEHLVMSLILQNFRRKNWIR